MDVGATYIAVDWGTSNRRAFLLDRDGAILDVLRDDRGVLAVPPGGFPEEIERLRRRFGADEVIASGMVGSTRGWVEAAYVPAPAGIDVVAAALREAAPAVRIVPGVSLAAPRHDVMRGEETQVIGAVAAGLVPADALVCLPGTHNKWATLCAGDLVDFATAMTGEFFAMLRAGGTLAEMLNGVVEDGPAFRDGLARAGDGRGLAAALFGVRAEVLLGARPRADTAAFASGILIGADVGARGDVEGADVHLVGSGPLTALYAAAIEVAGGRPVAIDAERAFVAGIHAIRSRAA